MVNTPDEVQKKEEEELDRLAFDVVDGEIFLTNNSETIKISFGFVLGAFAHKYETEEEWSEFADTVGAVYADIDHASSRLINGLPMFTSVQFLHKDQLKYVLDKIEHYEDKFEEIEPHTSDVDSDNEGI